MTEPENKFASMMRTAREHQAGDEKPPAPVKPPPARAPKASPRPTASAAPPKGERGRPATGKRSDPAYESTTVFLRKATKLGAARLLLDDKEQDLSDVLETLLADWVRKHS